LLSRRKVVRRITGKQKRPQPQPSQNEKRPPKQAATSEPLLPIKATRGRVVLNASSLSLGTRVESVKMVDASTQTEQTECAHDDNSRATHKALLIALTRHEPFEQKMQQLEATREKMHKCMRVRLDAFCNHCQPPIPPPSIVRSCSRRSRRRACTSRAWQGLRGDSRVVDDVSFSTCASILAFMRCASAHACRPLSAQSGLGREDFIWD
jgi:hypothetical protein